MSTEMIPLALIDDPEFNSRVDTDSAAIKELAASMPTPDRQIQPITVEKVNSRYLLVAGSRRVAAARLNNWSEIRAEVRDETDSLRRMADNFMENNQREDLTLYECARWLHGFKDKGAKGADIASATGYTRSHVSNLAGMYERLPPQVLQAWREQHPAATFNVLQRIATIKDKTPEKTVEAQLNTWDNIVKLTEKYEAKVDPEEEGRGEGNGATPAKKKCKKTSGCTKAKGHDGHCLTPDDKPFKVPNQRFFDLISAVKRSKLPGGVLAIACMKALVGETNKVKDVWDADAGTQAVQ